MIVNQSNILPAASVDGSAINYLELKNQFYSSKYYVKKTKKL